ncbi:hypothetical protein PMAC_000194 [Pneumocystis sp. 'macacae']|nr:hypothetical protein PMAC_000194 [Pneumocystis sp. 'macacae']
MSSNQILINKQHFFQTWSPKSHKNYESFGRGNFSLKNRKSWYITGLISLAAGAYYVSHLEYVPVSNRRRFNDVSLQMEKRLSQQTYLQIMRQYRGRIFPLNHPISRRVQQVMARLIKASKLTNVEWEIHVIDDPQRNAFILPGGKVFVFSGILPICKNEDGLAVVLAHETAHQIARHSAEKLSFTKLVLFGYFIISLFYDPSILSRAIIDLCFLKPNSRKLETEADYIGLILMSEACYDPNEAPRLWKRMSMAETKAPPKWLSTHPTSESRIAKINQWIPENIKLRIFLSYVQLIMKHEKASKSIELSHLIIKKKENTNDSDDIEVHREYSVFIRNKEDTLNEKRQWAIKIVLLILIANFSLGVYYFEHIFHNEVYVIHKKLNIERPWLTLFMVSYMLINSLIPIIFTFVIEKYGMYTQNTEEYIQYMIGIHPFPVYITGFIFLGHCLYIVGMFLHMKYFALLGMFISK